MQVTPPLASALIALIALAGLGVRPAAAESRPVLVLAPEGNEERLQALRSAMEAHLSGYSVEVVLGATGPLPESFPKQADQAEAAVDEHGALAAIWVDDRHGMVFVLVNAPGAAQILQRPLPPAEESWGARCDAVASMVHSALAPWLRPDDASEEDAAAAAAEVEPAEPTVDQNQLQDGEIPFKEEEPEPPPPTTDWLILQLRAGYGPVVVNTGGSVQHGGRLGAGLIIGDHLEFEVALDLLVPLAAENVDGGQEIDLVRWPLRIALGGFLSILSLDLGLKAGVTIDFTRIRGVETHLIEDDTERVNPGFAAALYLRYRILEWLAVWIEGGIDLYNSAYDYTRQDVIVIRYSAIQGRVSGGLAALFRLL